MWGCSNKVQDKKKMKIGKWYNTGASMKDTMVRCINPGCDADCQESTTVMWEVGLLELFDYIYGKEKRIILSVKLPAAGVSSSLHSAKGVANILILKGFVSRTESLDEWAGLYVTWHPWNGTLCICWFGENNAGATEEIRLELAYAEQRGLQCEAGGRSSRPQSHALH